MAEVEEIYRGDRDHHSGPVQAQGTAGRPKTEASTEEDGVEVIGRQHADRDGGIMPLGERRCSSRKPGKREASRVVESREHFQAARPSGWSRQAALQDFRQGSDGQPGNRDPGGKRTQDAR